ncbi:hypothetical protein E2C01_047466 [Portunus trituberculatus]|uniref:Uncharacterized protein n=1 Tax=Portunus trituberculatus TaxID=210409 RepID=A0A5B7G170_PORTR|nr:hypothetical protein [Portunus trituberculatus]
MAANDATLFKLSLVGDRDDVDAATGFPETRNKLAAHYAMSCRCPRISPEAGLSIGSSCRG